MSATLKVWNVSYNWSGSYGAYRQADYVVVAELQDKAIGMVAQENPDFLTDMKFWSATEIPTDCQGVHWVSGSSS